MRRMLLYGCIRLHLFVSNWQYKIPCCLCASVDADSCDLFCYWGSFSFPLDHGIYLCFCDYLLTVGIYIVHMVGGFIQKLVYIQSLSNTSRVHYVFQFQTKCSVSHSICIWVYGYNPMRAQSVFDPINAYSTHKYVELAILHVANEVIA